MFYELNTAVRFMSRINAAIITVDYSINDDNICGNIAINGTGPV
jgi:hypothetical protein